VVHLIYDIIRARQPEIIQELRRRFGWVFGQAEVVADGHTYRDVTSQVAAASEVHDPRMDHATWRRQGGALRQVRQA
jgi:hypothetical protein